MSEIMSAAGSLRDSLYSRLRRTAETRPAAEALVVDGEVFTYRELHDRVVQAAGALQVQGCGPGDAVAVAVGNSLDFVVAALATFAIGGVLVPLNPRFKADELQQYIDGSRPRAIIHPPALDAVIAAAEPPIAVRAHSCAALGTGAGFEFPTAFDADAAAIYMFSSGSTGKSKRITRSQTQLLAEYEALAATVGLGADDRVLCTVPLYHAHGFANALMAALMSGATLVLLTAEFNARATMNALVGQRASVYASVPFMLKILSETRFATAPDLSAMRRVISAGAPVPEAVHRRFFEQFGVSISQLYGSTETGAMTINVAHAADKPASVGRPLAGYEVEIRDEEGGRLDPGGGPGEIWFRSRAMTRRYDDLPDMSAQCFVDGWFFAGDTGYQDADGDLYVTGRTKLMINVAGYKVDPLEVEGILAQHPKVAEVVVLGIEHPGYGEKIKAVVVPHDKGGCSELDIIGFATARLADYKVPKLVEFRDEIPRSPLGKVLRKYLQA